MTSAHLPDGKVLSYGTATASYQVEGSTKADGRGPSIWDTFAAKPGTIVDGSDGSIACGSYERLDDDLALLGELGVAFYRFSIAWPRIQPDGRGRLEPRGFAYYDRLVDGLLERGIAPMATLYHWDLPQPLEDAGGWPARDTAQHFADYAATVQEHLGDRVHLWATLNEPWCSAFLGYAAGVYAPGRRDGDVAFRAAHHLLLGHGLAAARLHDAGADAVGIVLNLTPVWPERAEAEDAARVVDAVHNRIWLDPLVHGRYADDLLALAAPLRDPAVVQEGDLATVAGSLDWLGINYYTPARVDVADTAAAGESAVGQDTTAYPGLTGAAFRPRQPRTAMGWEIEPAGLEDLLVQTAQRAPGIPMMVTENGAAFADENRDAAGAVDDPDRVDYLDTHLAAVEKARQAGADVRAYIAWTLLDNFEWAEGYTKKFGLVEIEADTLRRVPKASYRWYADRIRASG
ncbi:MAG: GH1 family beta-glucosidase [Actinomycetes bacterium]